MFAKAVLFDLDGTLTDSGEGIINCAVFAMERLGIPVPPREELGVFVGPPLWDTFRQFGVPSDRVDEAVEIFRSRYVPIGKFENTPYSGIRETLETLSRNHRLFIVSNSQRGYPEVCMEKLGLGELISGHLCFGDTQAPKGETIRILMERHGITSAAYIGDTQGDAEAARDAGIPFVWASYGFGAPTGWIAKADAPADLTDIFR